MKRIKSKIANLFGVKGSFAWALNQMKKGRIVATKSAKTIKYRINPNTELIQRSTSYNNAKEDWKEAALFVDHISSLDWVIIR